MDEFQRDLEKNSASKTSATTSSIASDFVSFKTFIVTALNTLQQQMEFLRLEMDRQEMRRRRKILLFHGIPEVKSEDLIGRVTTAVAEHLNLPNFSSTSIKSSYRLGRTSESRARPVVVKFAEVSVRDKVWFAKTKFKGTGITQSEFLTQPRHSVFLEARKRFGVTNCWTRDGCIYVISSDGVRHRVESLNELEVINVASSSSKPLAANSPVQILESCSKSPNTKTIVMRPKRVIKK
ncbi:unnamed protein product, partial [Iphiclides podalirius]